jgi:hypothetical protein
MQVSTTAVSTGLAGVSGNNHCQNAMLFTKERKQGKSLRSIISSLCFSAPKNLHELEMPDLETEV